MGIQGCLRIEWNQWYLCFNIETQIPLVPFDPEAYNGVAEIDCTVSALFCFKFMAMLTVDAYVIMKIALKTTCMDIGPAGSTYFKGPTHLHIQHLT